MGNKLLTLVSILLVTSCGGGTKSTTNPTNNSPSNETPSIMLIADNPAVNQAIDLLLYAPANKISQIQWQQTAGNSTTFLAANSKEISFTPEQAGEYTFTVTFNNGNNAEQTLTKTFTVTDTQHLLNARLGHAALEGNKVSLRAWRDSTISQAELTWQQISGPTVSLTDYSAGDDVIFFNAPNVNTDQVVVFEVSTTVNGQVYSDQVAVLVENTNDISDNAYFTDRVATVFPYNSTAEYANNLVNCVYSNQLTSSCTLQKLPLIAQQTTSPDVDDIMDRVVVSHQWMAERFKQFLLTEDTNNDFKNLLRATTAIVISYDVRPSFYWAATGAIYLDASNLWITPEERDTINEAPDYRASFGNDLQFVMPWRYVKNNDYANTYFSASSRVTRSTADGLYSLASLLYHELTHANDFFPSTEWFSHSLSTRVLDAATSTDFESDQLAVLYPLASQTMTNLAKVSFAGETATTEQKNYLPSDIEVFFKNTGANDYYNFSSDREDYAMLFEEFMMYNRYGVQRDVAITNRPQGDPVYANDYIVQWGQRGRIASENIKPRVKFVASQVLPEFDADSAIANLPAVVEMISGDDWIQNLTLNTVSTPNSFATKMIQQRNLLSIINQANLDYAHPIHGIKALPNH